MHTETRTFQCAHAVDGDWRTLTESCLAALGAAPAGANLGFVYVSDALDEDFERISNRLRAATGIADWVGTIGYGVIAGGREFFDRPAMVVMLGALAPDSFRLLASQREPGEALAPELMAWIGTQGTAFGVLHGDPRNAYLGGIIDSIADDTEGFLVGGLTASRGQFYQLANGLTEGGISGVLFAGHVRAVTGLTQGCTPIGPVRAVTAAENNVLMALDGRPALAVLKDDIGVGPTHSLAREIGDIHAALPIAGAETEDYLVRNLMGIDAARERLAIGERLRIGDRLMFVRRDGDSAMDDLRRMLDDLLARAPGVPRAALYYSCIARGPNLFGQQSEELGAIARRLGPVPLAGFFANGEIANNRLYGYTGVLTLLF
jgi:small ligand-binding sensory domain FIST